MYKHETEDALKTYSPPFKTATIAIDEDEQPIKISDELDEEYPLYAGNCSCEKRSKNTANFIVLGQTGAGKTTFVDSFVNYLLGIEIYDKFRYRLCNEKQIEAQRTEELQEKGIKRDSEKDVQIMSMTSTVNIYHIPAD